MILTFWNKFSLTLYKYKEKKKKKKYNNYLVALTKHFQEGMGNKQCILYCGYFC